MQIDRLELLGVLNGMKAGLSTKAMIEQTDHFCFTDGMVYTYNDREAVSHPLDLGDVEGAVEADSFLKTVKRFKTKKLTIKGDDESLTVCSGKSNEAELALTEITLPLYQEEFDDDDFIDLPGSFTRALNICRHSVGKEITKPILTCVHASNGFMYASDGKKLTRFDFGDDASDEMAGEDINIPSESVRAVTGFKPTRFQIDDSWIHFGNDGDSILSVRYMEGKYLSDKCDALIDGFEGEGIVFPVNLAEVLERADVFAKDIISTLAVVTIELTEGTTLVTSGNEYGNYKGEMDNKYKGRDLMFSFPPGILMDMADDIESVQVNSTTILFESVEYAHVIALMHR